MRSDRRSLPGRGRRGLRGAVAMPERGIAARRRTAAGPTSSPDRTRGGGEPRSDVGAASRQGEGLGPGRLVPRNGEGTAAVVRKIDRDANRFKQIVRGKIKSDLRKYITHGEMIGKTGGELVSIPLPQIEIPEFRYGTKNRGGVGQGPGDVGTPIGRSGERTSPARRRRRPGPSHPRGRADPGRAGRRSSARGWRCPGSSPRGGPTSSRRRTSTPASARPGPRASATSSAPTRRPSSGRSPRTRTTPATRWSSRSARTSSTAPGTRSPCPTPTPSSST